MSKTLFVVDDSATMRTAIELTFVSEDVTVITHDGSHDALERAREARPDAAILDVNLGATTATTGYSLARAMRQDPVLAGVPVLLLYSDFSPLDEASARACGAIGQISKPFDTTALIDRVKAMCGTFGSTATASRVPLPMEPAPRASASPTGAQLKQPPTAPRPFASSSVLAPPSAPLVQRPPPVPLSGSYTHPRPTVPLGAAPPARQPTSPGPTFSLEPIEPEFQLEPAILAEFSASTAARPHGPIGPMATAPLRANTPSQQSSVARITAEFPTPKPPLPPIAPMLPLATASPSLPEVESPFRAPTRTAAAPPVVPPRPVEAPVEARVVAVAKPVAAPVTAPSEPEGSSSALSASVAAAHDEVVKKASALGLSPAQVEAISALTREVVERVVWDVVPQLAETMIREEIRRLLSDDPTR